MRLERSPDLLTMRTSPQHAEFVADLAMRSDSADPIGLAAEQEPGASVRVNTEPDSVRLQTQLRICFSR